MKQSNEKKNRWSGYVYAMLLGLIMSYLIIINYNAMTLIKNGNTVNELSIDGGHCYLYRNAISCVLNTPRVYSAISDKQALSKRINEILANHPREICNVNGH